MFRSLRTAINPSFRLMFVEFITQIRITHAARQYNVSKRTLQEHYTFVRCAIHRAMEESWLV